MHIGNEENLEGKGTALCVTFLASEFRHRLNNKPCQGSRGRIQHAQGADPACPGASICGSMHHHLPSAQAR